MFIQKISVESTQAFRRLEGLKTMASQHEGLRHLHNVYVRLLDTSGSLSADNANAVERAVEVLSEDR